MALRAVGHRVCVVCLRAIMVAAMAWAIGFSFPAQAQHASPAPARLPAEKLDEAPGTGLLDHFRSQTSAAADDPGSGQTNTSWHEKTSVDVEPAVENWTGYDGYRRVASLYSGATWSVGGNLRQDGLRLRMITGASTYSYGGQRYSAGADDAAWTNFIGRGWFTDMLAGWQHAQGDTTVKVFAGWSWSNHLIGPYDTATRVQGRAKGAKAALEIWHNWTPYLWSSLDLSAAQPHRTFSAQLRTGWRIDDAWSLGPEANVTGHAESTLQRLGLFVRRENLVGEFTISGGALRTRDGQSSGYGAAQYLRRF
jgi:hypothetical protein